MHHPLMAAAIGIIRLRGVPAGARPGHGRSRDGAVHRWIADAGGARARDILLLVPILLLGTPAGAQAADPPAGETVDMRAEWTQYVGAAIAGEGDRVLRYGGRVDGFATIDAERLGLWKGLSIKLHGEYHYGQSSNRIGSFLLLPVNAGLSYGPDYADLSYSLVQRIGRARIEAGKINLMEASTSIPIVGGGGKDGFQHIGLATPPALLASPKIYGAILTVPAGPVILGVGVWTPQDWSERYTPEGVFDDGLNLMLVGTLPAKIGGQQGLHSLSLFLTSRKATTGERFPDLTPPPGLEGLSPPRKGGAHIKYSVQQFLWRDPVNPKRGVGLFGHIGLSSGTPDILDWSMTAGLAGSVPWAARPADRFGIGYFHFALAERLQTGLQPLLPVHQEQGVEVFYTAQIGPHVRLTAHSQLVDPVVRNAAKAAYVGLRAKADF
jgi:porin